MLLWQGDWSQQNWIIFTLTHVAKHQRHNNIINRLSAKNTTISQHSKLLQRHIKFLKLTSLDLTRSKQKRWEFTSLRKHDIFVDKRNPWNFDKSGHDISCYWKLMQSIAQLNMTRMLQSSKYLINIQRNCRLNFTLINTS